MQYNILNLLLTSTAWSLQENTRPLSFMYTDLAVRSDIFPLMAALTVNKKLIWSTPNR